MRCNKNPENKISWWKLMAYEWNTLLVSNIFQFVRQLLFYILLFNLILYHTLCISIRVSGRRRRFVPFYTLHVHSGCFFVCVYCPRNNSASPPQKHRYFHFSFPKILAKSTPSSLDGRTAELSPLNHRLNNLSSRKDY